VKITIDPELKALIPPLRPDELEGLEENIRAEGCRDPLVIWGDRNVLVDGHNRFEICGRLGISYQTRRLDAPDRDAVKLWMFKHQLGRRNLTDDQRGVLGFLAKEQEKIIAMRERGKKGGRPPKKAAGNLEVNLTSKLSPEGAAPRTTKERTRAAAAKDAKVPESKLRSIEAIKKTVEETTKSQAEAKKVLTDILKGNTTIRQAKADVKKAAREKKKREELERRAAVIEEIAGPSKDGHPRLWEVRQGDCLDVLGSIDDGSARLIFADPPYNIGIRYGDHYDDSRPADEFDGWCQLWLAECLRKLTDDGSLWLLVNHEWARTLCVRAEDLGFHLRQWLTWYESFGVNTTKMFNRCSRPLLWLVKDAGNFVFNDHAPEVRRPSDRQEVYGDARANADGKLWDDVWGIKPPIPRVVGTAKERMPEFPTQLPLALLRPIVACASAAGDLVIDPFNGSGTTGAACIELGRRYIGVELSEHFAGLSRTRLAAHEREMAHAEARGRTA
jgi:site-specific DNA-methyltransferase (adenine-specific)